MCSGQDQADHRQEWKYSGRNTGIRAGQIPGSDISEQKDLHITHEREEVTDNFPVSANWGMVQAEFA